MKAVGMDFNVFYKTLRQEPDLKALYHEIQEARADMMVDECYKLGTDKEADPKRARVSAEILLKIAGKYDAKRFGEKMNIELGGTVSIQEALSEAAARVLPPQRDLKEITDAEYTEITTASLPATTDRQSGAPQKEAAKPAVDPFED
jgi:hypothetical protein